MAITAVFLRSNMAAVGFHKSGRGTGPTCSQRPESRDTTGGYDLSYDLARRSWLGSPGVASICVLSPTPSSFALPSVEAPVYVKATRMQMRMEVGTRETALHAVLGESYAPRWLC